MSVSNQVVSLQIQVTETGAVKISTIAQDLDKLGKTATDSSTGMIKLNDSMGKGTISGREMSMAIGSISEAFGVANPVMSQGLIHATRFFDAVKEGSTASRITAAGVVGIGTAIAIAMASFEKGEEIAKRFAEIQRASDALDLKNITSELAKTTVELDTQSRVWDSWSGAAITVIKRMGLELLGIPNDVDVALESMEKLRVALERALPFANQAETAKHSGTMADLTMSGLQTYTQNLLATGQLPLGSEVAYYTTMQALIERERQAAIGVANATRLKEFNENGVTGAADILDPSTQKRYDDAVAEINAKARNQLESLSGTVTKLEQAIVNSNANLMGIQLKFVASTGDAWRGGEELKRSLMEQTTAWTANETDKRIDDVDRWERAALDKIREKEGFTRDSEGLEEQIVSTASARRIQIYQEEGDKVRKAIQGKVDPFEEAAKLQLQTVTVAQEGIVASYKPYFDQLAGLYGDDAAAYAAELDRKRVQLRQQLLDGTISEQTYYTISQQLQTKANDQWNTYMNSRLAAAGIEVDQNLAREAGYYNKVDQIRQTNLTNLAAFYLALSEKDSDYWAGMKSGMVSAYGQLGTFWQNWARGWQTATLNTRDLLSSELFDVLRGDFAQAGKDAENFGKAMLKVFTDILASAATRELLGLIVTLGSDLTGTSAGSWSSILGLGTTAASTAAGGGAAGGGGALGTASSGASLVGGAAQLYNWLTGGTTASGVTATSGAGFLDAVSGMTAEASDLGLTGSMAGAGAAAGGTSLYTGMSAATLADLSGAPIGAAVGGAAASAAPLAAWLGPLAAIGAPLMAILMNDDNSNEENYATTTRVASWLQANPTAMDPIIANPLSPEAWAGVGGESFIIWDAMSRLGWSDKARAIIAGIESIVLNKYPLYGSPDTVFPALEQDNTFGRAGMIAQLMSPTATADSYSGMGSSGGNAAGIVGYTAGPTQMLVGEAGTETVAVLRNPRQVDLDAAGRPGGVAPTVQVTFTGPLHIYGAGGADAFTRKIVSDIRRLLNVKMSGRMKF